MANVTFVPTKAIGTRPITLKMPMTFAEASVLASMELHRVFVLEEVNWNVYEQTGEVVIKFVPGNGMVEVMSDVPNPSASGG